jgi:hypothetical protein
LPERKHSLAAGSGSTGPEAALSGISSEEVG